MKFWNYIIIFLTLMLFLEFAGIQTGLTSTLDMFGITINENRELTRSDLGNSPLWNKIFGVGGLLVAIGGGILIGTLTRTRPENYVVLPLIIFMSAKIIETFVLIINYSLNTGQAWVGALISLIFIPLGVGFTISTIEFFRGTD